jgi:hypothetical protein
MQFSVFIRGKMKKLLLNSDIINKKCNIEITNIGFDHKIELNNN